MESQTRWLWVQRLKLCMDYFTQQGQHSQSHCWVPNLSTPETNTEFSIYTISRGDQPVNWLQVNYIEPLPSWKRWHFVHIGINSWFGFAFLALSASAKTLLCVLYRMPYPPSWCSTQHHFWQGTNFTASEMGIGTLYMEFTGLNHLPHYPETPG